MNKMFVYKNDEMIEINHIFKIISKWKNDLSLDNDAFFFVNLSMTKLNDFSDALFHFYDRNKNNSKKGPKVQKIMLLLFKDTLNQTLKNIISRVYDTTKEYMVCHMFHFCI